MVKTKTPINQASLNPVGQTPYLDIESSPDIENPQADKINAKGVVLFDPVAGTAIGSTTPMVVQIADGSTPGTIASVIAISPNTNVTANKNLYVGASQLWANVATSFFEPARTPTIWKSALISANGSTVIWAAVAGKKHRIMGWRATLVNGTTAAAASLMRLLDAAAATGIACQICGAAMGAVATSSIIANESWQNGFLSAAVNTDWNVDLSSVLAVAGVFVEVWGTEE
jgi:hypothetical protein